MEPWSSSYSLSYYETELIKSKDSDGDIEYLCVRTCFSVGHGKRTALEEEEEKKFSNYLRVLIIPEPVIFIW